MSFQLNTANLLSLLVMISTELRLVNLDILLQPLIVGVKLLFLKVKLLQWEIMILHVSLLYRVLHC